MTHIIRETAAQHITRLQAEGRAMAARIEANIASGQTQATFCIHGHFLKRTEVDTGGGDCVFYEPCSMCNGKATP